MRNDKLLTMWVPAGLRSAFLAACKGNGRTASAVLRGFMRRYVWKGCKTGARPTFSRKQVAQMLDLLDSGMSQWDVARRFGCVQSTVSRLTRGRRE